MVCFETAYAEPRRRLARDKRGKTGETVLPLFPPPGLFSTRTPVNVQAGGRVAPMKRAQAREAQLEDACRNA